VVVGLHSILTSDPDGCDAQLPAQPLNPSKKEAGLISWLV